MHIYISHHLMHIQASCIGYADCCSMRIIANRKNDSLIQFHRQNIFTIYGERHKGPVCYLFDIEVWKYWLISKRHNLGISQQKALRK